MRDGVYFEVEGLEKALRKLKALEDIDEIEYLGANIDSVYGNRISIHIRDRIKVRGNSHKYLNRIIITCNSLTGHGSIEKIEHAPFSEEQEKLKLFYKLIEDD